MRKQTKIVALAAVLALGASFTSMAATYDWRIEDDGWYCYDEDGEAYDEEWCLSYGKEYFVDEDGKMVTSQWVEDGDDWCYVGSDGTKTVSDWRFVYPEGEEDDEDSEQAYFYFNEKGVMQKNKRIAWKGNYYYLDGEGKMLTGWVEYVKGAVKAADDATDTDELIYCLEDGARASELWLEDYGHDIDPEEDDVDEDDLNWYWIDADGEVSVGRKKSIDGETYFFNVDGEMLHGWVVTTDGKTYTEAKNALSTYGENASVYFCGNADQGWAKKDKWIKVADSKEFWDADEDTDTYWFWIASNGKVFVPKLNAASASNVAIKHGDLDDGAKATVLATPANAELGQMKEIEDKTYLFNNNGRMLSGLQYVDGDLNYFGGDNEGQRKTGTFAVTDNYDDSYEMTFAKKASKVTEAGKIAEYEALTGAVDGKLYINGILQKSSEKGIYKKVSIGEADYLVNYKGKIQTDVDDEYDLEDGSTFKFPATQTFVTTDGSVLEGSF